VELPWGTPLLLALDLTSRNLGLSRGGGDFYFFKRVVLIKKIPLELCLGILTRLVLALSITCDRISLNAAAAACDCESEVDNTEQLVLNSNRLETSQVKPAE